MAVTTKMGSVSFSTAKPANSLDPVEERPVPQSRVPGEDLAHAAVLEFSAAGSQKITPGRRVRLAGES